jgi:hypothetical protein
MNEQPKHSPAPWYWDDKDALPWTDYDDAESAPFLMNANGCPIMTGSDIRIAYAADGHLIAAAPMLYEFARIKAEQGDAEAKSMLDLLRTGN